MKIGKMAVMPWQSSANSVTNRFGHGYPARTMTALRLFLVGIAIVSVAVNVTVSRIMYTLRTGIASNVIIRVLSAIYSSKCPKPPGIFACF